MNFNRNNSANINLSIIIINYNLAIEIENCLISLLTQIESSGDIDYEIIIVDNNSTDKDLPQIEKKFDKTNINFYYLSENVGFGKGCNYGSSKAKGDFFCFLNPDTIINDEIFSPIINLLNNDKSIGIIGPKQLTRTSYFDFSAGFYPNIFFELFHVLGIGVFFEGLIMSLYSKINKKDYFEVGWILGAAIFIRSELFKRINGFDPDYFMFSEEVDLCKRVSDLKFKIIYYPKYQIHHIGSVSGKKNYKLFTIRTYSSKEIYISKHYKSLEKLMMKLLLRIEVITQIAIWAILFPINKQKSEQKMRAFFYLLKNNLKYQHDTL